MPTITFVRLFFQAYPFDRETLGLGGSEATIASVAGQFLADGALAASEA